MLDSRAAISLGICGPFARRLGARERWVVSRHARLLRETPDAPGLERIDLRPGPRWARKHPRRTAARASNSARMRAPGRACGVGNPRPGDAAVLRRIAHL